MTKTAAAVIQRQAGNRDAHGQAMFTQTGIATGVARSLAFQHCPFNRDYFATKNLSIHRLLPCCVTS
jgi:hypothetical protein